MTFAHGSDDGSWFSDFCCTGTDSGHYLCQR
jgi:hypothetical protein